MKNFLIISFLLMLFMSGCTLSEDTQSLLAKNNQSNTTPAQEETKLDVEKTSTKQEEPQEIQATIPKELDVQLGDVSLRKENYGEQEEYELTVILTTTQYDKINSGNLQFTPKCTKASHIILTLNKKILYDAIPACDVPISLAIEKNIFNKGPNIILFRSKITKSYDLEQIELALTYNDGTIQNMPADDFTFKPNTEGTEVVKELSPVLISNTMEQTFTLNAEQLLLEYYLNFASLKQEGELIITLNGKTIYADKPAATAELLLPTSYLKEGKNTLQFIGTN